MSGQTTNTEDSDRNSKGGKYSRTFRIKRGSGLFSQLNLALCFTVVLLGSSLFASMFVFGALMLTDAHQRTYADTVPFLANEAQLLIDRQDDFRSLTAWGERVSELNKEVSLLLVTEKGRVVWHAPQDFHLYQQQIDTSPLSEFAELPVRSRRITISDPFAQGSRSVFAASPIYLTKSSASDQGWFVIRIEPRAAAALKDWVTVVHFARLLLPSLVLFTFIGWLLLQLLIKYLSRNLNALIKKTNQLKDADYSARLPVRSNDAIGQLSRIFDEMADAVIEKEQRVATVESERRRLVATVLHDLRAPLTSMSGFLEIAIRGDSVSEKSEYVQLLEDVGRSIASQRNFLDNLTELSALDLPDQEPRLRPCDLKSIVRGAVELMSAEAARRRITLLFLDECRGSPLILGDEYLIGRAVNNLIKNALTYTPQLGRITVRLRDSSKYVSCDVADTGIGIAEDEQARIFEDFFRSESGSVMHSGGTGLGLGIVRRIIEKHHGTVELQSLPGEGSTFTLVFPIQDPSTPAEKKCLSEQTVQTELKDTASQPTPANSLTEMDFSPVHAILAASALLLVILVPIISFQRLAWWILLNTVAVIFFRTALRLPAKEQSKTVISISEIAWPLAGFCIGVVLPWFGADLPNIAIIGTTVVLTTLLSWTMLLAPVTPLSRCTMSLTLSGWLAYAAILVKRPEIFWVGIALGTLMGFQLWYAFRSRPGKYFHARFASAVLAMLYVLSVLLAVELYYAMLSTEVGTDRQLLAELIPKIRSEFITDIPDVADSTKLELTMARLSAILPRLRITVEDEAHIPVASSSLTLRPDLPYDSRTPQFADYIRCSKRNVAPFFAKLIMSFPERLCASIPLTLGNRSWLLHLSFSEKHYADALRKVSDNMAWVAGFIFTWFAAISALVLQFICKKTVSERLSQLVSSITIISRGQYHVQPRIAGADEIAVLSSSLNDMADALSARQRRLEAADLRRRELVRDLIGALDEPNCTLSRLISEVNCRLTSETAPHLLDESTLMYQTVHEQIQLVEDLFQLTKLELGEVQFALAAVSLEDVMANACYSFNSSKQANVADLLQHPDDPQTVQADLLLLERALVLIFHCIDKMNAQKSALAVTADSDGNNVFLLISAKEELQSSLDRHVEHKSKYSIDEKAMDSFPQAVKLRYLVATRLLNLQSGTVNLYKPLGRSYFAEIVLAAAQPQYFSSTRATEML